MPIRLPNFLIAGTQKGGSTSLYQYLRQHPDIFMPDKKEPRFLISSIYKKINPSDPHYEYLTRSTVFTFEEYVELFKDSQDHIAVGEASITCLYYYEIAIPRIKELLGDIKIIIILRDPVERAFSAYCHLLREQFEVLSFENCLELEDTRRKQNWDSINFFKDIGFYYSQVKAYLENFDQVNVILLDDLARDALKIVSKTYDFLEVDSCLVPDVSFKHNVSGIPRNKILHKLINYLMTPNIFSTMAKPVVRTMLPDVKLRSKLIEDFFASLTALKTKNLTRPRMKLDTREYLKEVYRGDILKLQDLIHRDLSHWLD